MDIKDYLRWFGMGFVALIIGAFSWEWITSPMVVTVTGIGTKTVPASSVSVSFAVADTAATPVNAITSVKAKTETLRKFLIQRGVSVDDIVESQINVVPAQTTAGATQYQASVSMGAKTADVATVGDFIVSLYGNGAAFVSQPIVSAENQDKLNQGALDDAMKDARKQANQIGMKNWKFIKKIIGIAQANSGSSTTVTSQGGTPPSGTDQSAALNGVFKITQAVSVSYKMW